MVKRITVFYSWQSDSPSKHNLTFIEDALNEALRRLNADAILITALRNVRVELDRDTFGVPGSPPIADTILRKIEDCAVFVADLSFVGESKNGFLNAFGNPRLFPNPNVLVEYGFALKCLSHAKIIGVMNAAYGEPDRESLPFDLRHLLWPIQYRLDDSSSDKDVQFEQLTQKLANAIHLILVKHPSPNAAPVKEFTPKKQTKNKAVFYENTDELVSDRSQKFVVPEGAKAYLRVYPKFSVPAIKSAFEAKILANQKLQPMGRVDGYGFDRNIYGGIVFEPREDGKLYNFTQLFLSGEIWGIDAKCVNADCMMDVFNLGAKRYIPGDLVEDSFINALHVYLIFAESHIKLPLPLKIEAGLVGIKDYPIDVSLSFGGKSLLTEVIWDGELPAYGVPAWDILEPLFNAIWANCGLKRNTENQAQLVKRYAGPPLVGAKPPLSNSG